MIEQIKTAVADAVSAWFNARLEQTKFDTYDWLHNFLFGDTFQVICFVGAMFGCLMAICGLKRGGVVIRWAILLYVVAMTLF